MGKDHILQKITSMLVNLDREGTLQACQRALDIYSPEQVINALSTGLSVIGTKFESHEYFLSELMMAGVIMKSAQTIIRPRLTTKGLQRIGKVVIGTVAGDLHDIGKNITIALLEGEGFQVIDLGVNVPTATFVQAVEEEQPDILGLSALLRATVPEMGTVIAGLKTAGLRNKTIVIVGGLPLNETYAHQLGADYYASDAWKGVELMKQVVKQA